MDDQPQPLSSEFTTTATLEAVSGALVITVAGLDAVPPGTYISINIQVPDRPSEPPSETSDNDTADR